MLLQRSLANRGYWPRHYCIVGAEQTTRLSEGLPGEAEIFGAAVAVGVTDAVCPNVFFARPQQPLFIAQVYF